MRQIQKRMETGKRETGEEERWPKTPSLAL